MIKDNLKVLSKNADGTVHFHHPTASLDVFVVDNCLSGNKIKFSRRAHVQEMKGPTYLGKMAIMGKAPYIDYEMKPPLLYYLYGLGGKIFGFGDHGMRILALLLVALSCFDI